MALKRRRTEPFQVMSLRDDAVAEIGVDLFGEYLRTRDFSLISDIVGTLKSQPWIFLVRPMLVQYEHMLSISSMSAKREFVRAHIADISGDKFKFVTEDGLLMLSRESCDDLPLDIILELYSVIVDSQQRARGELDFFSVPDTWSRVRVAIGLRRLPAVVEKSVSSAGATGSQA